MSGAGLGAEGGRAAWERGKRVRVARRAGASWAAGTCWAERDEGRAGPAEEKKEQAELGRGERVGRTGLGCWVGFGFPIGFLFSFSFLFLIQTKFEFKNEFEFKPHSNKSMHQHECNTNLNL